MFEDRQQAGIELARRLASYARRSDVTVLALPRGGVPVAFEIARALGAPLDVLVVRKLGVPFQPELAFGAIASGGAVWLNESIIRLARLSPQQVARVRKAEQLELERREALYRRDAAPLVLHGRTAILVDDGMATGASLMAAARAVRSLRPSEVVVAVPVAPPDGRERLGDAADRFVCVETPEGFQAVGNHYRDFSQTTDAEVRALLLEAQGRPTAT